jgi:hypothetical protein
MQRGILVGLDRANRNGGLDGRKLRLIALDDGYEPARTAPNMRQLIENDHVLAIIGNAGSPTAIVAVPLANEQRTLLILTLALEKIRGSPMREAIVDALEGLGQFDIGLGEPLHLSRTEPQGSHRVWPTLLKENQLVPFQWSDIKALAKGEALP